MPLKIGFADLLFMLRQRLRGQRVHKRAQGNVRDRESRGGSDRTEAENRSSHKTLFDELTRRRRSNVRPTAKRSESYSKQWGVKGYLSPSGVGTATGSPSHSIREQDVWFHTTTAGATSHRISDADVALRHGDKFIRRVLEFAEGWNLASGVKR